MRRSYFLKIIWGKTGMLGDARQHFRANLVTIMESEDVISPFISFQNPMRSSLPLNSPADALKCGKDPFCPC